MDRLERSKGDVKYYVIKKRCWIVVEGNVV